MSAADVKKSSASGEPATLEHVEDCLEICAAQVPQGIIPGRFIEVTDDAVLAPQADDVDDDPSMARSTPDDQLFHGMSYLGRDFQQGADD